VEGNVKYKFNCTVVLIHKTFIEFGGVSSGYLLHGCLTPWTGHVYQPLTTP